MERTNCNEKPDFKYIYFLKFIAILLITNSHFKHIYEGALSLFAFGGALGCALFFFCSGYTLGLGKFDNFWIWMAKRVIRIYPTLWIVNIMTSLVGKKVPWYDYIFPTDQHYWFLQAILVFYILFFFVMKYAKRHLMMAAICLVPPFLLTYFLSNTCKWTIDYSVHPYRLHWYYNFAIILIGAYYRITLPHLLKNANKICWFLLALICFVFSYGLKFIVEKSGMDISTHLQLLFPLGVIAFTLSLFHLAKIIHYGSLFDCINRFFAGLTLEIYLVQFLVIECCSDISFPLRFFVTVLIIVILAYGTNKLVSLIVKPIKGMIP